MVTVPGELQLEARDGSVTIFDTTAGPNNVNLTRPRDPLDPEPADSKRGPDGLWDGFTGSGYLDMGGNVGDAFSFDIDAAAAGTYHLTFRYASVGDRPMSLAVNGSATSTLGFTTTGSFASWSQVSVDVTLHAGTNTIRLANVGNAGPNLDSVQIDAPVADTTADEGGDLSAVPSRPSSTVSHLDAVEFRLNGVDSDIVSFAYSTDGGVTYAPANALVDGQQRVVTLDLSSLGAAQGADVLFRVTDDDGNTATADPAHIDILPDGVVAEVQLEARDGSVTIFDTTPGPSNKNLTQPRDALNPEAAGGGRGADGLWDGFTGDGYLDMGGNVGDAFAFGVDAPTAGVYTLTFRHANVGDRPMALSVDGASVGTIAFLSTAVLDNWVETSVEVTLKAGDNTIRLANVGNSGPNLDRVIVTYSDALPPDVSADEDNNLAAAPSQPSSTVNDLIAVGFNIGGVDPDIVGFAYSTNGGTSFTNVNATGSGDSRTVTLNLSSFSNASSASVIFRVTDDDGNIATTAPATVSILPNGFLTEIQLEARDGSVTIFDTTPGPSNKNLTVPRDPLNPEAAGGGRGADGLWDGFTGAGYLDMGLNAGDAFGFNVSVPTAGTYALVFRHANTGDRPMLLSVDGAQIGEIGFNSTGALDSWVETTVRVNLEAGTNSIRLANVGNTGPNFDRVVVTTSRDAEPGPREVVRIHFQDDPSPDAPGYLVDNFLGYGNRGNGQSYGWVTESSALDADGTTATPIVGSNYPGTAIEERTGTGVLPADGTLPPDMLAVDFDAVDSRLTGYAHFDQDNYPARAAWQLATSNGWYEVTVSLGDVGGLNDSLNRLFVEGQLATEWTSSSAYKTGLTTVVVEVTDGFLTLSAQGGVNTEIQYVEVRALPDLTPGDAREAPADYAKFVDPVAVSADASVSILTANGDVPDNIDPTSDLVLGINAVAGRGGISFASLGDGSIRLYETLSGDEVTYSANTTGGFDSLTIAPSSDLKPYTSYTLVIQGFEDIGSNTDPNAPPREFQKFSTTFVTGPAAPPAPGPVAFDSSVEIASNPAAGESYTSIEMSPDQSFVYVTSLTGTITRWAVDQSTGAIIDSTKEVFAPGGDFNTSDGRRGIIGIAFDPEDSNTIWISDNYPVPLSGDAHAPDFSGRISKVTLGAGGSLSNATVTPYVTGLPRSNHDHVTNSLEFRLNPDYTPGGSEPHYLLYVSQGSNSAMGYPDTAWGFRPERLLNAAVLEIDRTKTAPVGGFDVTTEPVPADGTRFVDSDNDLKNGGIPITSGVYSGAYLHFDSRGVASVRVDASAQSTLIKEFYDPFDADSPVKIFAEGFRNAYDLVWHSNGFLYLPTNGSAAGGSTPDDPSTPQNEAMTGVGIQPDYLFRAVEGRYYGHPNPLTDHYILNGGNPTDGQDKNQVGAYPSGTNPEPDYDIDGAYSLLNSRSPNGSIEYMSDVFGDQLQHALIFTQYSSGDNLRAVLFDSQGNVTDDFIIRDRNGAIISYVDPLDLIEGSDGRLYVLTLNRATGQSQIVKLEAVTSDTPVAAAAEINSVEDNQATLLHQMISGDTLL